MELNKKYKSYQSKLQELEGMDKKDHSLRDFHLTIENIFDNIKSHKSSRDFKWIFLLLSSLVILASALHIAKYSIGWNLLPLVLLIAYWIYYRFTIKKAIQIQTGNNKQIADDKNGTLSDANLLLNRTQYILNGIDVLETRIKLIRNQYAGFFPFFSLLTIDLIRGPLTTGALITTIVMSILLGGVFWIYYFKNELVDLENSQSELLIVKEKLNDFLNATP